MTFKLKKDERYIFATDLDGTFLAELNNSIHIDGYEAVEKIKEAGHHFVITTGRSWWWTKTIYEQVRSIDASIHFSGAIVHHPHSTDFDEYRTSLSHVVLKDITKKIDVWDWCSHIQAVGRKNHATFSKGDDIDKLFFNCYEIIYQFDIRNIQPEEVERRIKEHIGDGYVIRTWKHWHGENNAAVVISPQGTTKSEGLKRVAEYYDVPQENVVYFGDNINDIDALQWAGQSYAVANAIEAAKEAADEVLELTNDEGAVPKKIIELLEED